MLQVVTNYHDRLDPRWNISTAAQYNNSYYFVCNYNYLYLYCLIRILSTFGSYSLRTIERRRLWGAYLYLIVVPVAGVACWSPNFTRICYSGLCWSSYRPTNIMYVVYTHTLSHYHVSTLQPWGRVSGKPRTYIIHKIWFGV